MSPAFHGKNLHVSSGLTGILRVILMKAVPLKSLWDFINESVLRKTRILYCAEIFTVAVLPTWPFVAKMK